MTPEERTNSIFAGLTDWNAHREFIIEQVVAEIHSANDEIEALQSRLGEVETERESAHEALMQIGVEFEELKKQLTIARKLCDGTKGGEYPPVPVDAQGNVRPWGE